MTVRKKQSLASIVGANISHRRKELGLTQEGMAEKPNMGGDSLSRIENGLVAPRFQRLEKIAAVLGCAVADLFRQNGDSFEAKLVKLDNLLRLLPPEAHDDAASLMKDIYEFIKKYFKS